MNLFFSSGPILPTTRSNVQPKHRASVPDGAAPRLPPVRFRYILIHG